MKKSLLNFILILISILPMSPKAASSELPSDKFIVYQMMFHLWGNTNEKVVKNGSLSENGVTKFSDVSAKALKVLKQRGFTHLYMTGIIEHATMEDLTELGIPLDNPSVIKGRSGSPFAIKDYYDVNSFFANNPKKRIEEFQAMVKRIHKAGLKLIIDFVPNHLARFYYSDMTPIGISKFGESDNTSKNFDPNNNFYYLNGESFQIPDGVNPPVKPIKPYTEFPAKVSGNNVFSSKPSINDWYETVKLNYGLEFPGEVNHFNPRPKTWDDMLNVLNYWTNLGIDGFRCDMAEMVPVEFWEYAISKVKEKKNDLIFIAEIYQPQKYHSYINQGGFDYLYDKVGLYDAVRRLMENKPESTTEDITKVWQNESGDFSEKMLRFLENHDEQRINTPSFAGNNIWSTIPGMVITASLHNGPLMLYFGQEFGERANEIEGFNEADDRTTMFDFYRVDSHQRWLNSGSFNDQRLNIQEKELESFYLDLMKWVNQDEVIRHGKFFDLQYAQNNAYNHKKIYSYLRYTDDKAYLIIVNFNALNSEEFTIQIPDLAKEMIQNKSERLKLKKAFLPPNSEKPIILNNKITIPSNSSLVLELN